jgi:hypothetical protein
MAQFMFATGIENSYPTIAGPDGRPHRVDQMELSGHYRRWREDFGLVRELGIEYLRYGPPYYRAHLAPGKYDWSFADETFNELSRLGITPIADLCHFGVPDWVGGFDNPDWPHHFAEYARAFADRYPWIRLYTPVNEIFVAAAFSGPERLVEPARHRRPRLRARARAPVPRNVMAMRAILASQGMIGRTPCSSRASRASTSTPRRPTRRPRRVLQRAALPRARPHLRARRVDGHVRVPGRERPHPRRVPLVPRARRKPYCVLGTDYYATNEHLVRGDGAVVPSGEIFGYYVLTRQYFQRYRLPVMHTETNADEPDSARWLWKEWAQMVRLKQDGIPIVGFTWYSLTDQVDWDNALREQRGTVNPRGLYDLDRNIRPAGRQYRKLIAQWRDVLPTESVLLRVDA